MRFGVVIQPLGGITRARQPLSAMYARTLASGHPTKWRSGSAAAKTSPLEKNHVHPVGVLTWTRRAGFKVPANSVSVRDEPTMRVMSRIIDAALRRCRRAKPCGSVGRSGPLLQAQGVGRGLVLCMQAPLAHHELRHYFYFP